MRRPKQSFASRVFANRSKDVPILLFGIPGAKVKMCRFEKR